MKPNIIVRKGNKFVVDETKILPYMLAHKDMIIAAISQACEDLKSNPDRYSSNPVDKLKQLNNNVYELLKQWKVYKD